MFHPQRPGRPAPDPQQVPLFGTFLPSPQDGYCAASPSLDISRTAGINGASSARGYGSGTGSRFYHPDPEGELPR